jgi:uncharacterized membrane protein
MASLALAALFFIAIHLGIAGTRLRDRITGAIGEGPYLGAFSAASIGGLVWLVVAYRGAPYVPTSGLLLWWKPFAIALMLPSVFLVVVGLTTPNPTSVRQERRVGDVPRGIVRVTRHPFLIGVALWAIVHLVGNGDVASLLFFGTWAVVSMAGPASIDAKRRRLLGAAWAPFAARTSIVPFARGRASLAPGILGEIGAARIVAALAVYGALLALHGPVIGFSPFPA